MSSKANMRDLEVLMLAKGLSDGEQQSGVRCPFCKDNDKSFSVKRDGTMIFWRCHRSKCGLNGMTRSSPALNTTPRAAGSSKYASWLRSTCPLSPKDFEWVKAAWHMDRKHVRKGGIESTWTMEKLILPIYNGEGKEVGATVRAMEVGVVPKSVICMTDNDSICASFYEGSQNPDTIIIVEDQASAIRASFYCSSVALLGTNLDILKARAIARTDCKHAIFCLDADAFSKSIKYSTTYGSMFPKFTTVLPVKDLKNMTEKELASFMRDVCNLPLKEE